MNLRQLDFFRQVAERGSFTAAARVLRVSQPAIGLQIKQLEEEYGVSLLQRHSRGAVPTREGRVLLRHINRIFIEIDRADQALKKTTTRIDGPVRLGVTPTLACVFVPDFVGHCGDLYPNVHLSITEHLSEALAEAVVQGALDLAFGYDPVGLSGVNATPLYSEDLYLVGPARAGFEELGDIAFKDLEGIAMVLLGKRHGTRSHLQKQAEDQGLQLDVRLDVEATAISKNLLLKTGNHTVVPFGLFSEEIGNGELSARRITDPDITRTMNLVSPSRQSASRAAESVAGLIQTLIDDLAGRGEWGWRPVAERAVPS